MGEFSLGLEEKFDINVVNCYLMKQSILKCSGDISQAPLTYEIHAILGKIISLQVLEHPHQLISFLFGLGSLLIWLIFLHEEFGKKISTATIGLVVLSNSFLASTRMILTHSNIIFIFFTTILFTQFYYFYKKQKIKYLLISNSPMLCIVGRLLEGDERGN